MKIADEGGVIVFKPGSRVTVGDKIPGTVLEVSIGAAGVCYEVSWWDGNNRFAEWLAAEEVRPSADHAPIMPIGFHPGSVTNC